MSKTTQIVAAAAILVVAVALYVSRSGGQNDLTTRSDYNCLLKCRACGNEYKDEIKITDDAPFACTKCGKKEAWQVWECSQCQKTFLPELEGDPPRQPMIPTCPTCKGQSVGRVSYE